MTYIAKTVGFKPGERNVFFHILTACNLSCSHCYINHKQHGENSLTKEQIIEWLQLFVDKKKKTNLILLGGEPTLHRDLPHVITEAKKAGFFVTVDTNGFLFNDFLNKISPNSLDYLSFSLDGPNAEVNDPIRGKSVFDTCVKNIRRAVSMGFSVSVIFTTSLRNKDFLHKMVPLLVELKVKKFFIQVIGLRGKSAQHNIESRVKQVQVSREEWLKIVPEVALQAAARGIEVTYPKVFLDKDELFECAGNVAENFFIFPNGRVYKCPLCEDYPVNAYHIENNKLIATGGLTEESFFALDIKEGCVMNKLLQPDNIEYDKDGGVVHRISCCLLKEQINL